MNVEEQAFTFSCSERSLVGVLHRPERVLRRGLLVVPGAPQYRVGSHRQFVSLAREAARSGIPVMRFDYRGMGDSEGSPRSFEKVDDDLGAAIDAFLEKCPALEGVVLWGFCDGASAAGFYAAKDPRVCGLTLINPWVRDRNTTDQALLRHYYLDQLKSSKFWKRLLGGDLALRRSLADLMETLARRTRASVSAPLTGSNINPPSDEGASAGEPLWQRLSNALIRYRGEVLFVLSGADLTAQEFRESVLAHPQVKDWLGQQGVTVLHLEGANHNYSQAVWRRKVHDTTIEWLTKDLH